MFAAQNRRRGRPAHLRSPDDSPLRDGNRDRRVCRGHLFEEALVCAGVPTSPHHLPHGRAQARRGRAAAEERFAACAWRPQAHWAPDREVSAGFAKFKAPPRTTRGAQRLRRAASRGLAPRACGRRVPGTAWGPRRAKKHDRRHTVGVATGVVWAHPHNASRAATNASESRARSALLHGLTVPPRTYTGVPSSARRAAKTLLVYLQETNPTVYHWLFCWLKENPIPHTGTWDEISGEVRKLGPREWLAATECAPPCTGQPRQASRRRACPGAPARRPSSARCSARRQRRPRLSW